MDRPPVQCLMVLPYNPTIVHGRSLVYISIQCQCCNPSRNRAADASDTVFSTGRSRKANAGHHDLLPEVRDVAHIREFAVKRRPAKRYNTTELPRKLCQGDLVLRHAQPHTTAGKLGVTWESPFRVRKVAGGGAYKLEELNGRPIPRTWNCASLKAYFS